MQLFPKGKKSDSMKTLTEEEIQERLYGEFTKSDLNKDKHKFEKPAKQVTKNSHADLEDRSDVNTEQDLFSFEKPKVQVDEDDKPKEKDIEEENLRIDYTEEDEKEDESEAEDLTKNDAQDIIDSFELDEKILKQKKSIETVTYTFPEKETPLDNKEIKKTKNKYTESIKDTLSSFKIDFAEFVDKIKTISPMVIGLAVLTIVFLIIVFNMWSRSSRNDVIAPSDNVAKRSFSSVIPGKSSGTTESVTAITGLPSTAKSTDDTAQVSDTSGGGIEPVKPIKDSFYTIQICVYEDKQRALDLVTRLKQDGVDAFYESITTRTGRVLYTVYRGRYETLRVANNSFTDFKKTDGFKEFPDSFIKWIK